MKDQYGLTYNDIENRIKNALVPQLLNHINRVKKRNELRAEIKRTHHIEKEEQEEEEEQPSNPEKEVEEPKKDEKDKMEEEPAE